MTEMCRIFQLFHENVGAVAFAINMMNIDFSSVYTFANCRFAKIKVFHTRSRGTFSPLDATLIVIEDSHAA